MKSAKLVNLLVNSMGKVLDNDDAMRYRMHRKLTHCVKRNISGKVTLLPDLR